MRQWKIALSLAIVGALAAPVAFRTYIARQAEVSGFQPMPAQQQKEVTAYLEEHNYCRDLMTIPMNELPASADACFERLGLLRQGEYFSYFSQSKFLAFNLMALLAGFVVVFGLAYLIPILIRGLAFLARRYWNWLNA